MGGSKKCDAITGSVSLNKTDANSDSREEAEVINVKADGSKIKEILAQKGFYPAFHMGRKCWVSIILDVALEDKEIKAMIHASHGSL